MLCVAVRMGVSVLWCVWVSVCYCVYGLLCITVCQCTDVWQEGVDRGIWPYINGHLVLLHVLSLHCF